eukprot:6209992-Pleurochrysis_carterae.AAC.2
MVSSKDRGGDAGISNAALSDNARMLSMKGPRSIAWGSEAAVCLDALRNSADDMPNPRNEGLFALACLRSVLRFFRKHLRAGPLAFTRSDLWSDEESAGALACPHEREHVRPRADNEPGAILTLTHLRACGESCA